MSSVYAIYDIAMNRNNQNKPDEKPKAPCQADDLTSAKAPEKKPEKTQAKHSNESGYTIVVPATHDTQNNLSVYCSITSSDR